MFTSVLENIICSEFEQNVGRFQIKSNPKMGTVHYAMDITIALNIFHDHNEEGYRNLHLRIYAPYNYVAVLVKEDWTVISEDDIDHKNDCLKSGKDYLKGGTGWLIATYHDSVWRSTLHDILFAYRDRLSVIKDSYWYKKTELSDSECSVISGFLSHGTDKKECRWDRDKIVQSPFPKMSGSK